MALIPHLNALRPARRHRAPTPAEIGEYHAVRLALMLLAGRFQADTYENDVIEPIPGDFLARNRWLQHALQPLARVSPTVALLARLVDIEGPRMAWDEPLVLRRHLRCMATDAARLGRRLRAAQRGRA